MMNVLELNEKYEEAIRQALGLMDFDSPERRKLIRDILEKALALNPAK